MKAILVRKKLISNSLSLGFRFLTQMILMVYKRDVMVLWKIQIKTTMNLLNMAADMRAKEKRNVSR